MLIYPSVIEATANQSKLYKVLQVQKNVEYLYYSCIVMTILLDQFILPFCHSAANNTSIIHSQYIYKQYTLHCNAINDQKSSDNMYHTGLSHIHLFLAQSKHTINEPISHHNSARLWHCSY